MLNYTEITQLITSVGFPIVMCIAMGWFIKDTTKKHREQITDINKMHKEEVKQISEAINNNTLALQHLTDTLGR